MYRLLGVLLRIAENVAMIDAVAHTVRRVAIQAALAVAAVLLALAAAGCATASLWIWAIGRLGPAGAPLLVAGVFAVLCLIVIVAMNVSWGRGGRRASAGQAAGAGIAAPVTIISAAARGFMLGLSGGGAPRS